MLNLAMLLENQARKHPEREAVVSGNVRLTYAQVDAMANQVAGGLTARGIRPGDHVALSCPNIPYFPVVYYGILKAGGVVVPLNVLLTPPEIAYHLNDSDAKAYVCFEGTPELPLGQLGYEGFSRAPECEHFILVTAGQAAPPQAVDRPTLSDLMKDQPTTFEMAERAADDTAVILYTSGTTGQPKGAELTHSNMLLNAIVSRDLYLRKLTGERDVMLVALPLFHSFGQTVQMNAMFFHGGTLVLVPRFDPATVLDLFVKEKINFFDGVPTMFWALLNYVQQHEIATAPISEHLRLCVSGGAALPVEVLHNFERTFNLMILEGYGLSETAPAISFNEMEYERKPGSIGRPLFATEMRLVDDNDQEVPVGERGEIVARGHSIMKGYYSRPEATEEAMRGGWFHTGDIAYQDADGYFFIVDRKKDMILRGGYNVYPRELEEVLMTHPGVSLVAVVGVAHPSLGEEVKAFIVRKPGATVTEPELIAWCKERMAAYKYPREIEFREALPMTATGKILKRELRADDPSEQQA